MDQVSHEPQGVVYEHIWNWMFFLITVLLVLVLSVELKFILNLFFSAEWFACNRILLIFMFDYLYNLFRWWLFFFLFSNKFHKQQLFFLSSLFYFFVVFFLTFHPCSLSQAENSRKESESGNSAAPQCKWELQHHLSSVHNESRRSRKLCVVC